MSRLDMPDDELLHSYAQVVEKAQLALAVGRRAEKMLRDAQLDELERLLYRTRELMRAHVQRVMDAAKQRQTG